MLHVSLFIILFTTFSIEKNALMKKVEYFKADEKYLVMNFL